MKTISNEEFDHVFLDVFSDLLSNIVTASENAANEILDISSKVMDESVQSALTTFQDIYFSKNSDELKYEFNCEIDDILDQVQGGVEEQKNEQSDIQKAGEQLANVQKILEKTISSDSDLKAKIAPIMVGMQFAETTNQHLDRVHKAWQEIILHEHSDGDDNSAILFDKIEKHVVSSVEIKAFYLHVKKQDAPASTEEDLCDWIDNLFD